MNVALGRISLDPPVFLAPMAGITDVPFRNLALRLGAGLVVSEMVASGEVLRAPAGGAGAGRARARATAARRCSSPAASRGRWPRRRAGRRGRGRRIIDINFGCPAKKVTSGLSGSALMREPELALRLIEAVVGAVEVPVTVKMRLGWDAGSINAPEIARRAEAAGVRDGDGARPHPLPVLRRRRRLGAVARVKRGGRDPGDRQRRHRRRRRGARGRWRARAPTG